MRMVAKIGAHTGWIDRPLPPEIPTCWLNFQGAANDLHESEYETRRHGGKNCSCCGRQRNRAALNGLEAAPVHRKLVPQSPIILYTLYADEADEAVERQLRTQ